jgi:hypothetical protein
MTPVRSLTALILAIAACLPAAAQQRVVYLSGTQATIAPSLEAGDSATLVDITPSCTVVPSTWGAGVQWDAHEWFDLEPEQWQRICERVAFMRPGVIRCMVQAYWYCTGYQDGQPVYVWENLDADRNLVRDEEGYPVDRLGHRLNHNLKRLEKLYRVLDFCQAHDIQVLLGEWGAPAKQGWVYGPADHLGGPGLGLTMDDPRYAQIAAGFVQYLIQTRGYTCIRTYNLGNEVNYNYPQDQWLQGMRNLHAEFTRRGLASRVTLVAPDAGFWGDLWLHGTAAGLPREAGVWDYHWYVSDRALVDGSAGDQMRLLRNFAALSTPDRHLVLGELGMRDGDTGDNQTRIGTVWYGTAMAQALAQFTRAGLESCLAWDLDDAIHINGPIPPRYRAEPDTVLKVWGFWNSLGGQMGRPQDEAPRPWYYAWSVMSRAFPAGSRAVATSDPGLPGLTTLAAMTPAAGSEGLSVAVVNDWPAPRQVLLRCAAASGPLALARYVYSEAERPADARGYPVPAEVLAQAELTAGLQVNVPAGGFVVLTTLGVASPASLDEPGVPEVADDLGSLHNLSGYSANLGFNGFTRHPDVVTADFPLQTAPFWGDRTRVNRADDQPATLTWRLDDARDLRVGVFSTAAARERLRVQWSSDQQRWREVPLRTSRPLDTGGGWQFAVLSPVEALPDGVHFVRVELLARGLPAETQVSRVEIGTGALPPLELTRVESPAVVTGVGYAPELPKTVRGWLNHELPVALPVEWSAARAGAWDAPGEVTVGGSVTGTRVRVQARVSVLSSLEDTLDDWGMVTARSDNLTLDAANAAAVGGDASRTCRRDTRAAQLTWALPGVRQFTASAYLYNSGDVAGQVVVEVSVDGATWTPATLTAQEQENPAGQGWRRFAVSNSGPLPEGTRLVRLTLAGGEPSWLQQVGSVTLRQ